MSEIKTVGSAKIRISGFINGVEDSFTNKTVGMKFKIGAKYCDFINNGINRIKVANTNKIVIAELASFVLSTNIEINTPIPNKS